MALNQRIKLQLCLSLNLLQQFFGRERLPRVERVQYFLAIWEKQGVANIKKDRFDGHEESLPCRLGFSRFERWNHWIIDGNPFLSKIPRFLPAHLSLLPVLDLL